MDCIAGFTVGQLACCAIVGWRGCWAASIRPGTALSAARNRLKHLWKLCLGPAVAASLARGVIMNWGTHPADLRVKVRGADGTIMQEKVTRPDDDVIDSHAESGLFCSLLLRLDTRPMSR